MYLRIACLKASNTEKGTSQRILVFIERLCLLQALKN